MMPTNQPIIASLVAAPSADKLPLAPNHEHLQVINQSILAAAAVAENAADPEIRTPLLHHLRNLVAEYAMVAAIPVGIYADLTAPNSIVPSVEEGPWYPDNSGSWIEVSPGSTGRPPGLAAATAVLVLFAFEREDRSWVPRPCCAADVTWGRTENDPFRVVAYKPAA